MSFTSYYNNDMDFRKVNALILFGVVTLIVMVCI